MVQKKPFTKNKLSMWKLYQRKEERTNIQPLSGKGNFKKLFDMLGFVGGFYCVYLGLTGFPHYYPGAVGFTLLGIACILLYFKK